MEQKSQKPFLHHVTIIPICMSALFASLIFLSACVSAPVQEMSDARQAIDAVRQAGVSEDNQAELLSAEAYLKKAQSALQLGEYQKARYNANAARNAALQAQRSSATDNSVLIP